MNQKNTSKEKAIWLLYTCNRPPPLPSQRVDDRATRGNQLFQCVALPLLSCVVVGGGSALGRGAVTTDAYRSVPPAARNEGHTGSQGVGSEAASGESGSEATSGGSKGSATHGAQLVSDDAMTSVMGNVLARMVGSDGRHGRRL